MIDAYLDHLRVERRLAEHTLESYARDLRALAAFAAGDGRALEALDRRGARSVRAAADGARAVAAVGGAGGRGDPRLLSLPRRSTGASSESPADDLRPPRAWPALPKFLSLEEVDALHRAARRRDAARPARSRDDRAAVRDRACASPSSSASARPICTSTSDYLTCIGKGNKERLVPIGDAGGRLGAPLPARRRGRRCCTAQAARRGVAAAVRQRARRTAQPRRVLEDPEGARPPRRAAASRSARTCCGTRSRRICSSAAPTCARFR